MKKRPAANRKWKDEMLVDAFLLARNGATNTDIAHALQVDITTFNDWLRPNGNNKRPALRYALEKGRTKDPITNPTAFKDYVYQHLPEDLRALWDEIDFWSDHEDGYQKIRSLLDGKPDRLIQHLWVHAVIATNFNVSKACQMTCTSKAVIDRWMENDPDFPRLMDEIQWHKKNFFENALTDLAAMRQPFAVIFANKTLNKDRGYAEKVSVEHSGTINHEIAVYSIDTLNLPLETRREILDAMRTAKQLKVEAEKRTIDVSTHQVPNRRLEVSAA